MAMNPERSALHSIDSETRADQIEHTAESLLPLYEKYHSVIEKISFDPNNYRDLYGDEAVDRDLQYVERMKKEFDAEKDRRVGDANLTQGDVRKLAEILEFQVLLGIAKYQWIPRCVAFKTSEYDDIKHGVDFVLEYPNEENMEHIGLGVDVSFSKNLDGKFARIKAEIDNFDGEENRFGEVKYFSSRLSGKRGELINLPRVVTAVDLGVMEDLANNSISKENHIAQHVMIHEMKHQLETFIAYAEKNNTLCVPYLEQALAFIQTISEETNSENKIADSEYEKNTKIQASMEESLQKFFKV